MSPMISEYKRFSNDNRSYLIRPCYMSIRPCYMLEMYVISFTTHNKVLRVRDSFQPHLPRKGAKAWEVKEFSQGHTAMGCEPNPTDTTAGALTFLPTPAPIILPH